MSLLRVAAPIAALLVTPALLAGCLGTPESRSCADLPPGSPGCPAADPDMELAPDPDTQPPDRGPAADGAPPDMAPDAAVIDAGPDQALVDMAPVDAGPGDAAPDAWPGDEGPPRECEPGTARPCGDDEGACQAGQQFCNADGVYDACLGAVGPVEEACNGQDDDCDATVDEGCDCIDDETQPCGSDVGACSPGMQLCVAGAWGACEGAVDGSEEICDGVDNDCNGSVDDLPAIVNNQMCTVGRGRCMASGPLTCDGSNNGEPVCLADEGPPQAEACDLVDDDCDGSVDEDVSTGRVTLYAGQRAEERPAIAGYGEFHGVAWIDDGQVFFGLALGREWEVQPVEIEGFNGDDTIATHIALAGVPGAGFKLAVAYDGLGSGLTVLDLNAGGGRRGNSHNADVNVAGAVALAWVPEVGFAVAFERHNVAAGVTSVDVEFVPDGGQRPVRTALSAAQLSYSAPSVAIVDGVPIVTALRTALRSNQGDVVLAPLGDGSALRGAVVVGGDGEARNPFMRYLPSRALYAVVWDQDSGDARQSREIRFAAVNEAGVVGQRATLPAEGSSIRPSLAPVPRGREPVDRVAVVWERPGDVGFNIDLGWVVDTARGWMASPGIDRVFGEQGSTTGSAVAYAPEGAGVGVILTYDDTRQSAAVVASLPGACPQQP